MAELDWPAGMRQMAEALKDGAGVAKDEVVAQGWYRAALEIERGRAEQGLANAMLAIGWAY